MSGHTKGPWMAASHPSSIVGWPVVASQGKSICSVSYLPKSEGFGGEEWQAAAKEWVANARLIAAAPELLEALERIRDHYTDTDLAAKHMAAIARAAIAKAQEKSDGA